MEWAEIDNRLLDPTWYTTRRYLDAYEKMRNEDPVHFTHDERFGKDYWALTRYDDVKEYLNDHETFSSRWNGRVPRSPKRLTPEERHAEGYDVRIFTLDPPVHTAYRRPMNKHFSTPAVARLSGDIDTIVDEVIANVAERGECDLVEDLAAELPVRVVLRQIGVPEEDWPMLRQAAKRFLSSSDPAVMIDNDPVKTMRAGQIAMQDYCADLAIRRRETPADDLATIIGTMKFDGDYLSLHELKNWLTTIIAGGLETTRNATAVGLWLFMENLHQRDLLVADPSLAPGAVEEVLRWSSTARSRLRIATRDVDLHGRRIKAGDWVVGFQASANKDERIFADPHRFDIRRTPNDHVALGAGIHHCLGRALVRLELGTLLPRLLHVLPDMHRVEQGEPDWLLDASATGFSRMPIRFSKIQDIGRALATAKAAGC